MAASRQGIVNFRLLPWALWRLEYSEASVIIRSTNSALAVIHFQGRTQTEGSQNTVLRTIVYGELGEESNNII
jgi:hypothetical protein